MDNDFAELVENVAAFMRGQIVINDDIFARIQKLEAAQRNTPARETESRFRD